MKKFFKTCAAIYTAFLMACITSCSTGPETPAAPKLIETVQIPGKSYQAAKTETTYEQWKTVYDWAVKNGYTFANLGAEGSMGKDGEDPTENKNHPVTKISWRDAVIWCNALSEMEGLTPYYYKEGTTDFSDEENVIRVCAPGAKGSETSKGTNPNKLETVIDGEDLAEKAELNPDSNGYRLPTKDEWRYVAKGGEDFTYSGSAKADEVAWYSENSDNSTHPVALKSPNNYGIFDMTGNVREWCWDLANPEWKTRNNPGGAYNTNINYIGITAGSNSNPSYYTDSLGFRVFLNGVYGTKSSREVKEVGDIVFSDGSATPYTPGLQLTDAQKANAVAIIYYKGTECSNDGRERTLGLGLNPKLTGTYWCMTVAKAKNQIIPGIAVSIEGSVGQLRFPEDKEGKDNLEAIGQYLKENDIDNDTTVSQKYPAFGYANNYKNESKDLGIYEEGWYLGSATEMFNIYVARESVFDAINMFVDIDLTTTEYFWTSSQRKDYSQIIWMDIVNGGVNYTSPDNNGPSVLPIREF